MTRELDEDEDERMLVARLQAGDEAAFTDLVQRWTPAMVRLAASHVPNQQVAEEVVQDAWLALLRGIDGFDGRSTLRTWLYVIVTRRARQVGRRERRSVPFTAVWRDEHAPAVAPGRFHPANAASNAHGWVSPLPRWELLPEHRLHGADVRTAVEAAIAGLPRRQRQVMMARDVWGRDADEVCRALSITENHQRVLLHRARAAVRSILEATLRADANGGGS